METKKNDFLRVNDLAAQWVLHTFAGILSGGAAEAAGAALRSVTMATRDKHCQTLTVTHSVSTSSEKSEFCASRYARGMYDETVPVLNAREIESPTNSDEEKVVRAAMSKFNPPVRHTARHDFDSDSDSDSDEPDKFLNNISGEDDSPDRNTEPPEKPPAVQKQPSLDLGARPKAPSKVTDSSNSESDSGDVEADKPEPPAGSGRKRAGAGVVVPADGAYDPKQYQDLKVPPDMENIFQYIMKYTPQKIDIEFKLQPFVPEYVPGVGDIDAFLKVATPAVNVRGAPLADHVLEHVDNLGLTVLDEPAAEQSDSALLHLQLRAISKTTNAKTTVMTKKIENAEKNPKAIDRWIKDVSELHLSKPAPTVTYPNKMPDIEALMQAWEEREEAALEAHGVPGARLRCSLGEYASIIAALFDVPVYGHTLPPRIRATHRLFELYVAVRDPNN